MSLKSDQLELGFSIHTQFVLLFQMALLCTKHVEKLCFSEHWMHQNVPENYCFAKMVKHHIIDQFKQNWYKSVFELSTC